MVARAEVKFWKTELDRCVEEKQHWIARAANVREPLAPCALAL